MKVVEIILLSLSIYQMINCENKRHFYRCGVDNRKWKPIPVTDFVTVKKDKRSLGDKKFKDFKIYLDLINIKKDIVKFHLEKYEPLFISSLQKAVETLEALLKVEDTGRGYTFEDEKITKIGISDWNKTLIGTNAKGNNYELGIDLFIFGRFDSELDSETLASAGPSYFDSHSHRPLVGVVDINPKVDYSKIHSEEYFQSTIIHEFTHILGFLKELFTKYFHNLFSKTDEYGVVRYYINSTKVIEVAKKYYNCQDIDGVELEEYGGEGTAGSHWEARILLGEYMNGIIYEEEEVISEFTLALLEDMGCYKANYYTGGLMRFGKGKGCDFIKKRCIDSDHKINPLFGNEFFDSIKSSLRDASCSSGRQSRSYHYWNEYDDLPSYYQYFPDKEIGGYCSADYCPVSDSYSKEYENSYYTGQCSLKGNGQYGEGIIYQEMKKIIIDETHSIIKTIDTNYTSDAIKEITGETYSDHSFCYQSSLIKNGRNFSSEVVRAICYDSFCSDSSLTVKINDDYIVCPRTGGKIKVEGYKGFFLCPDYNLMCSGTVMCNDMFDCVEKKSETKNESYIYDYAIKTSQNIEDAEIADFENWTNYELSDNGICPKNCEHCYINKTCIKCRIGFNFVGSKNNQEIICLSDSEVKKGYYKENGTYFPCISNCDVCSNNFTCQNCSKGYYYKNSKCMNQIENCAELKEDGNCSKCVENYAFKENNRTSCVNKSNLENYYSKDGEISYYPCENELIGCSKCYYDDAKKNVKCYLCNSSYALYTKDNFCLLKQNINKLFYYLNSTHINNCSNAIDNCDECESGEVCTKCKNDFYMVDDFKKNCISKSNINIKESYLNDNKTIYYSCSNSLYHDVLNCKECISKSSCNLCQDNFTSINGNKSNCVNKSELNNKYIKDPYDESNYIKCENKYINNCDTCNEIQCLSCKADFTFINGDKSICLNKADLDSKYAQDPLDKSNYIKCEDIYNNCDSCSNRQCFSCKDGYISINDNYTICFLKSNIDLQFYYTNDNNMYYSCNLKKYRNKKECKKLLNETNTEEQEKSLTKQIYILQVQIINKLLKIFLTSSEDIKNGFHIKLTIKLYKNIIGKRNLHEPSGSQDVDLYLDNISGNIITLTSQEKFDEKDRVVVNKEQSNDYELIFLNNDNNVLDTLVNNKKIDNNEIVDFSKINSDFTINEYYIESSSTGCSFNLVSKDSIKESNKEIYLTFIEKGNTINNINAKCTLSSDKERNIPCSLEQEQEEKNCNLKSYVGTNGNSLFYIYQDNDGFQLSCNEKESNNGKIIIIIVAGGVAVLAIIIAIICCCLKKKKFVKIDNSEKKLKISSFKANIFKSNLSSHRNINTN